MSVAGITETRPYLTFKLGEEMFGQDVTQVREVVEVPPITKVPRTPDFMCGVINLRGNVVPVMDMRLMFGMPPVEATVDTCVVVTETADEDDKTLVFGALVDSVQEVFELEPEHVEPVPRLGTKLRTEFIKGMGKRNDQFIIILDIDRVFSMEEIDLMQDAVAYSLAETVTADETQ